MKTFTARQMQEIDRAAIDSFGIPGIVLMEHAGRSVAQFVLQHADVDRASIVILCGGGNNGGDGFVIARHLIEAGAQVHVVLCADRTRIRGDALTNFKVLETMKAEILSVTQKGGVERAFSLAASATLIVDALLGTGLNSGLDGVIRDLVLEANRVNARRIAVDIPTGVHADSGRVMGEAFRADHTFTFGFAKVGLVVHPGVEFVGELHVVDIGIPSAAAASEIPAATVLEEDTLVRKLNDRPISGHKGTFGHLLMIAGSPGKTGAAWLGAEAAMRSGVGLCTVLAGAKAAASLDSKVIEAMVEPLPEAVGQTLDGSDDVWRWLSEHVFPGKSAIAVGPGIPRTNASSEFVVRLVAESTVPIVIDADGLNALEGRTAVLSKAGAPIVLTPHPGEMGRLIGKEPREIQHDRLNVARDAAVDWDVTVLLKGARTVIGTASGDCFINPTGNVGMASGGMGDTLTGIIGSLLAQGVSPVDATLLGAFLHGAAGDRAADRIGGRGMLARDLVTELPGLLRDWDAKRNLSPEPSGRTN